MELGIFGAIDKVLGFYSNVAVAWIGAVVADIVINKTILKISPSYVEFKRAHLYNFNPVGFGAMIIASIVSIAIYFGVFGSQMSGYSSYVSLVVAMIASPIIAIITRGKYYIARSSAPESVGGLQEDDQINCKSCEYDFEDSDIAHCPYHGGPVCSLCCTLEESCHDMCKQDAISLDDIKIMQ